MLLYDANSPGPNPATVRQFVLERSGLSMDVTHIDLQNLANREPDYVNNVNARGEVPALRLKDGSVITEITAICAYFDEVAEGGTSLFGDTPEERAETNMWTRRLYGEVLLPAVTWWRGTDDAIAFFKGNRLPATDAMPWMKAQAERGLEQLNKDLEGRTFIAGDRMTMADILMNSFMTPMSFVIPWLTRPDLENVQRWREMMAARPSSQQMMEPLPTKIG
ncbi:glutathione S-transferase family protein [Shimia sp. R9_3]|uniref:glutathione S-transferase family protein n=1 Tax=Shimia sp. R9_3 TaxID=2821113 RepID=UPI001ADB63D2|nr:glutathione S-transferase family protein [Shimia sp. R9_3]MBO9402876.1 glutathione S-transferase family protein [Shimia sp. R9_3]